MKKIFYNIKPFFIRISSKKEQLFGKLLIKKELTLATVESCTGGLLSSRMTDVSGSSNYIKTNFVTYSYDSKEKYVSVKPETLANFGAVSEQCAFEMAEGLYKTTNCNLCISTTGNAGPSGDENKPVGLVYIGVCFNGKTKVHKFELSPFITRKNMKFLFSEYAINLGIEIIK